MEVSLIFPHQLFKNSPIIDRGLSVYLIEEHLFFKQYRFHKQKLAFHRASMKFYEQFLLQRNLRVHYIESAEGRSDIRSLVNDFARLGVRTLHYIDPTDDWLSRRLNSSTASHNIQLKKYSNPLFLNTREDLGWFFKQDKKKFFQTKFYINERKKFNILVDQGKNPKGGKWSFDADNRKKYPRNQNPPNITFPKLDRYSEEAKKYVQDHFQGNPGALNDYPLYPTNFESSESWLMQFFFNRFHDFGTYEDAIVDEESILNHSVISPLLNTGLLMPADVIQKALKFSDENHIPINSTEGFIRQIIGWREFIRGVYECVGSKERTTNFWRFNRTIPQSFYDGSTGIEPIDQTIKKVLRTGYCHHIERLMILGNFMVLCEFDPDEVYRWFMEMFIDAYDWVMVPNIYGMSQYADGGLMSTKPYISSSNYILKMSNYKKGPWQPIWDGLFWRFMHIHRDFFLSNPRLSMLVRTFDKMNSDRQKMHLAVAEEYISQL